MQRSLLILILFLLVNSCTSHCINPGDGISTSEINIDVPVLIVGASEVDKAPLWVDSGIDIGTDEELPITVRGTINLCADTQERTQNCSNPKICNKVIVPSIFCSDGSQLNYSGESMDPAVVCNHSGGTFSNQGFYVDTNIKVDPGDRVKFYLVPSQTIKITDCYNIPPEVVSYSFNDLEKIYLDTKNKSSLTNTERDYIQDIIDNKSSVICEQGLDFVKIPGTKNYMRLDKFKGNTYDVYVNNSFAHPSGNKVFTQNNSFHNNNYWYNGGLVDVRSLVKRNEYDYTCTGISSNSDLNRFDTYDINYRCGNLCGSNIWGGDCVSTLRYKWEPGGDECKNARNDNTGLTKCRTLSYPVEKWADLLIAKIGRNNTSDNNFSSIGDQCLPGNNINSACMNFNGQNSSLQLDNSYLVSSNISTSSKIWLGISDYGNSYHDNIGGYHVEVRRSCVRFEGQDLYMYIGSNPGSVAPGDTGTDHIYIPTQGGSGVTPSTQFIINGGTNNNGNNPKSGRVYFGIKGAIGSDTVKDNFQENPDNNKYVVSIHRVIWEPIFSDLFKLIRDNILSVLYGTTGGISNIDIDNPSGLISATYNNIINNGLIEFTQAVLVLFIALSGIFFMLGFIQKTQAELLIRVIKIGVVLAAISPSSWELFGVTLFKLFVSGVDQIAGIFSGVVGSDNSFAFLDPTIGALLTKETWLRLFSIMWSGPIGFISFILLMWGIWVFLGAMITAVITYLMTIIGISLLLILTPLFIITILFKITKSLFEGWIKMMLSFAITPIIMFSSLALLHQVMMSAFYSINNFTACRGCIFNMKFDVGDIPIYICPIKVLVPSTYVSDYSFQDHMEQLYVSHGENLFGLPFNLSAIVIFIITVFAMRSFVGISESIAKDISGNMTPDFVGGGGAATNATQGLLSLIGQDNETKQLREQALDKSNVDPTNVKVKKRSGIGRAGENRELSNLSGGSDRSTDASETNATPENNAGISLSEDNAGINNPTIIPSVDPGIDQRADGMNQDTHHPGKETIEKTREGDPETAQDRGEGFTAIGEGQTEQFEDSNRHLIGEYEDMTQKETSEAQTTERTEESIKEFSSREVIDKPAEEVGGEEISPSSEASTDDNETNSEGKEENISDNFQEEESKVVENAEDQEDITSTDEPSESDEEEGDK